MFECLDVGRRMFLVGETLLKILLDEITRVETNGSIVIGIAGACDAGKQTCGTPIG